MSGVALAMIVAIRRWRVTTQLVAETRMQALIEKSIASGVAVPVK